MNASDIDQVRRFNRLVTKRIGVLEDSYLSRGRPLGEARVLFEIGLSGGIGLQALRACLGLDSGYLSRLMRSLEAQGVVALEAHPDDARARTARLTALGEAEYAAYDSRSDELAASLLRPLAEPQRQRLVAAIAEVESLLRAAAVEVAPETPHSAAAAWCLGEYYAELARRFDTGFDATRGPRFDPDDMAPPRGWFVMARLDGEPVGCGALKRLSETRGEVKRMWVAPSARGLGVAGRIMDALEALAAEQGFAELVLDTNGALTEAQALYRKRGYRDIPRYNNNPYAERWFAKELRPGG